MLGVNGTVLVGHGAADATAVFSAIKRAHGAAEDGLTDHIGQAISEVLQDIAQDDT